MPRIVEPEDEDSFGIARAGCHQELVAVVRALFLARKLRPGRRRSDFPTQLTRETEQLLKEAVEFAVQEYGGFTGTRGRRPWQSAEKHQQTTPSSKSCGRSIIVSVTSTNTTSRNTTRSSPWWFARNGTERHESRRIEPTAGRAGRQAPTRFPPLGITCYGFWW